MTLTASGKGLEVCFIFLPQPYHQSYHYQRASFWWSSPAELEAVHTEDLIVDIRAPVPGCLHPGLQAKGRVSFCHSSPARTGTKVG